ncbi:unnamed protein product [Rotaria socialis]|uniref:BED-type domain-containing protein n=1 Tax=Rotaria socialis TaxID=392032 RepID=A0A817XGW9_9BILA|nr:unnamed protein product [Rotaria socialis]CAF3707077.1 unnamed protein product [Rotaria socialis]CAF4432091.1 unnamed protein product [Rotaria socialis]CAF4837646.1 unnamed protein product [Rotaria socialis]
MSIIKPPKSTLSKVEIQALVTLNDPSISFAKPANVRSEVWTNYSQVYYKNEGLDYIICSQCKVVLKWISENGTRVMSHHNCTKQKSASTTPVRQRTISSYCRQSSLSKECPVIQKHITEACVI